MYYVDRIKYVKIKPQIKWPIPSLNCCGLWKKIFSIPNKYNSNYSFCSCVLILYCKFTVRK